MGIRIAKFEGENVWVVYQSVTGALYEPMFYDELSAWLYAHHAGVLKPAPLRFEKKVGDEVQQFIKLVYGGEDNFEDGDVYIDEVADVTAGTRRGNAILDELWNSFMEWQKNPHALVLVRQFQEQEED